MCIPEEASSQIFNTCSACRQKKAAHAGSAAAVPSREGRIQMAVVHNYLLPQYDMGKLVIPLFAVVGTFRACASLFGERMESQLMQCSFGLRMA